MIGTHSIESVLILMWFSISGGISALILIKLQNIAGDFIIKTLESRKKKKMIKARLALGGNT